jgi:hypothetical protein
MSAIGARADLGGIRLAKIFLQKLFSKFMDVGAFPWRQAILKLPLPVSARHC